VARAWVTLVGTLVALIAGLLAFALLGLRGEANSLPNLLGDILGGRVGDLLLLLSIGIAVAALIVVIVAAVMPLAHGDSTVNTIKSRQGTAVPEVQQPPRSGHAAQEGDERWIKLADGCVQILNELDQSSEDFDTPRRQLAEHIVLRLEEVLERSGVEAITDEPFFDRARHKPISGNRSPSGGAVISETLSPGFAVGHRILRRARVRVE
jgi:hypothetical protein